MSTVTSMAAVARHFGVRADTVRGEWRRAGMPGHRGNYDLDAITQWKRLRQKDPQREAEKHETDAELLRRRRQAEATVAEEQAKKLSLQNAETEGRLWDRDAVGRDVTIWTAKIRRRLTGLATEIATVVPGELKGVVSKMVADRVRIALKEAVEAEICGAMVADLILSEADRLREGK